MLTQEQILDIFKEKQVLLEGHFRLTSGRHAAYYMQCAQLLQYPDAAGPICEQLASLYANQGITIVVGPATGAIIIAYEVARALGVKALFTERDSDGKMVLRRGFEIEPEDKVLVVEDVVTTGGSCKEVAALAAATGAEVVGIGVLVDRSGGKVDLGWPLKALISMEIESYTVEECPLCAKGIPAIKPGSRPDKK